MPHLAALRFLSVVGAWGTAGSSLGGSRGRLLLGLLLLDFVGAYLAHWMEHRVKWMWKFHLVHHTDPNVDVTTANRHHPGESVVRFAFTALAVVVAGAPLWLVFLYQSISVVLSQFNHANIALPRGVDRALAWVFVSPDMHKVHHHYALPYTDTNFGNVFSVWDRLFRTYREMERTQVVYGVDTHMAPAEHTTVGALLTMPLRPGTKRTGRPG